MKENRLPDYLDHIQQAASDACSCVKGQDKDDFLVDKRTQQAVIMNLIIIGEAATPLTPAPPAPTALRSARRRRPSWRLGCR